MTLRDSLVHDHRRSHELFEHVLKRVEAGQVTEARQRMDEFALLLSRHIYAENEVLVPAFEAQPGTEEAEFINVMLQEHDRLLAQTLRVQHLLMDDPLDLPELQAHLELLSATMVMHQEREETGIYPAWDAASGEAGDSSTSRRVRQVFDGDEDEDVLGEPFTD